MSNEQVTLKLKLEWETNSAYGFKGKYHRNLSNQKLIWVSKDKITPHEGNMFTVSKELAERLGLSDDRR